MNRRELLIKAAIAAVSVKALPLAAAEKKAAQLPAVPSTPSPQRWVALAETLKPKLHEVVRPIVGAVAPHNATGNFTKIVQRLPVRIRLEPNQPAARQLRVGMSVRPSIDVRGNGA